MTIILTNAMSREQKQPQELDTVYLAGGCFWGMQAFFEEVDGVVSTEVGYANGTLGRQPSYEEVCTGETGFAETLQSSSRVRSERKACCVQCRWMRSTFAR